MVVNHPANHSPTEAFPRGLGEWGPAPPRRQAWPPKHGVRSQVLPEIGVRRLPSRAANDRRALPSSAASLEPQRWAAGVGRFLL